MCGIVAVTGSMPALPVLLDGLSRLEYRGYDSAGVALISGGQIWRRRRKGRLSELENSVGDAPSGASTGIGHTRWATHGAPDEPNAHPHVDCTGSLALVHNGIVENHRELRAQLQGRGHRFSSATDSEVMVHLIEEELASGHGFRRAVSGALESVKGAVAVAVVSRDHPDLIVAARRGSPLIIGRTPSMGLVGSDIPALMRWTRDVFALGDDQTAEVTAGRLIVFNRAGDEVAPERRGIGWDPESAEIGEYPDFMLKEIFEQPKALKATIGGRRQGDQDLTAAGISREVLRRIRRIVIVGCGTSYHAGLAARSALEAWAGLPVQLEVASEFRYRDFVFEPETLVVGISQSGETVDTLYAMRRARENGAFVLAVTNVTDSAITRESDGVLYTRAGPEIGVAATKTHTTQVAVLLKLALAAAKARGFLPPARIEQLWANLSSVPDAVGKVLNGAAGIELMASELADKRDFYFLGRGSGHAVAMEGALKLKEIAYVRAEAYAAGEMKHGPIALIEPGAVVVGLVGTGSLRSKMLSNIAEVKARGAWVLLVASAGDAEAAEAADALIAVPEAIPGSEPLSPIVEVIPLQLLAYVIARARGYDVDKPRNLAKTVTVE